MGSTISIMMTGLELRHRNDSYENVIVTVTQELDRMTETDKSGLFYNGVHHALWASIYARLMS